MSAEPDAAPTTDGPLATPPTIDVAALLAPIPGDDPTGRDLAYSAEFDAIREARKAEDELPQGVWQRETKSADWHRVVALGTSCLLEKTKDLQVAAWLTEALAQIHGFAGLRDGLRLMLALQHRFWETYHPRIDDGDLEAREGPFLLLNDPRTLPRIVLGIPLTDADDRLDFLRYKDSREVDNAIRKDPEQEKVLRGQGRITGALFDQQVARTPRRFYERLVADLRGAKGAFDAFEADTDTHFGRDAPSLINLRNILDDCLRLLGPILDQKRQSEPDPELDALLAGPDEVAVPAEDGEQTAIPANGQAPVDIPVVEPRAAPPTTDLGQILIDFLPRARALNELGEKLEANRRKHAELLAQMQALDREYEQLSRQFSKSQEDYLLLGRLVNSPPGAPHPGAGEGPGAG